MKRGKICGLKEIEIEFLKYLKEKTSPDDDFGYPLSVFLRSNGYGLTRREKGAMCYRVSRGQFAEKIGSVTSRTYRITREGLEFLAEID